MATNDRTKELIGRLESGIDALTTSEEWQRYLATMAKFHRYSFGNVMLIMFQRPDATRVAGFRKWQEMGRQVRKGESAIWILAPITVRDKDAEAEAGDGRKITKLIGWKGVPVFDISQTDGEDLPEVVTHLDGEDPAGWFGQLTQVALGLGVVSVTDADLGQANGVTHADGRVEVHPGRTPIHRVKTLVHETAHWVLGHLADDSKLPRGLCELEAESVAYVVMGLLGIDSADYSFGYVASWAGDDAEAARAGIRASGGRIQKAVSQIMDGLAALEQAAPERELVAA